jgi:hypothetical protein
VARGGLLRQGRRRIAKLLKASEEDIKLSKLFRLLGHIQSCDKICELSTEQTAVSELFN